MSTKTILKELKFLKKEIKLRNLYRKRYLSISEAATITGVSKSFIQKLVASRQIPHSKPNGKLIFIHRRDLETFLSKNYISSNEEMDSLSSDYILNLKNNKPV